MKNNILRFANCWLLNSLIIQRGLNADFIREITLPNISHAMVYIINLKEAVVIFQLQITFNAFGSIRIVHGRYCIISDENSYAI